MNEEKIPFLPTEIPIVPPEFSEHYRKLGEKAKIGVILTSFFSIMLLSLLIMKSGIMHLRGETG